MDECAFEDCKRKTATRGYCSGHYQQLWSGRPLTPIAKRGIPKPPCPVPGCSKLVSARGLCQRHMTTAIKHKVHPGDMPDLYKDGCRNLACQSREKLVIDHDHSCCPGSGSCGNCVRGVLCHTCNTMLGWVEKVARSEEKLVGLERYLESERPTLRGFEYVYSNAAKNRVLG